VAKRDYRESPIASGRITFAPPVKRDRPGQRPVWDVVITDTVIGDTVTKSFARPDLAEAFISEQTHGPAPAAESGIGGGPRAPGAAPFNKLFASGSQLGTRSVRVDQRGGNSHTLANEAKAPFNLRAVKEVLEEYGLDPTAEIAQVLQQKVKRKVDGKDVEAHLVGGVDRAKILTELLQYTSPKLKSTEIKVEDKRQLSDAELNERINRLVTGAPKQGGTNGQP
jgi:hypothetical protein